MRSTCLYIALCFLSIGFASVVSAAQVRFASTYTAIEACIAIEGGEDDFLLKCPTMNGATALMQYVEGKVGLIFLPAMEGYQLELKDMIELSPNADKVFRGKIEWRQALGAAQPCAAIIRVPTAAGSRLVITELGAGKRLGQARTNEEARAIADRACAATKVALSKRTLATEVIRAVTEAGVEEGVARFGPVFLERGISGVRDTVEACYATAGLDLAGIAICAALDSTGEVEDAEFHRRTGMEVYSFYRASSTASRRNSALQSLRLTAEEELDFNVCFTEAMK